jgi:hypothetical protein
MFLATVGWFELASGEEQMNRVASVCALILFGILTPTGAAHAEVIYLTCDQSGKVDFTIDTDKGTVNNLPARINSTSIDLEYKMGVDGPSGAIDGVMDEIHIDRVNGTITERAVNYWTSGKVDSRSFPSKTCAATTAPATKF